MALGPIANLPVPAQPASSSRDVGAAQRAFFQAALREATPTTAVTPAPLSTAAQQSAPAAATAAADAPKPAYRPGALLDIKI